MPKTAGNCRKVWLYFGACLLIYFLFSRAVVLAAPLIVDADNQYAFAQKLFVKKAYASAIIEFQRFIHFFPDDSRRPKAMRTIGKAYAHSNQYDKAINALQELIDLYPDTPDATTAYFDISDCYLELNQPQQAIITLQNLITVTDDPVVKDNGYYRMGWIVIDAGVWQNAAGVLSQTSPEFRKENDVDALIQATLNVENEISLKSPTLAGMLSIVPGAGQLYCLRYKDAASAFIVNGGLIWAAVESFENDLYALGTVITIFGFGFYSGNIFGAVASAHKYNQDETRRFTQKLRKQYRLSLLPDAQKSGMMLSFQYAY